MEVNSKYSSLARGIKVNKKIFKRTGVLALAGAMLAGSTMAYFSGTADVKKNAWSIVEGEQNKKGIGRIVETKWDELENTDENYDGTPDQADMMSPGHKFVKDPAIQNLSNYPAYAFLKVEVPASIVDFDTNGDGNITSDEKDIIRDLVQISPNKEGSTDLNNLVALDSSGNIISGTSDIIPTGNPDSTYISGLKQDASKVTATSDGGYGACKWILIDADPVTKDERDAAVAENPSKELKSTYVFMYTSVLENGKFKDTANITNTLFNQMYEPDFYKVKSADTTIDVSGALIQTEDVANGLEAYNKLTQDGTVGLGNSPWYRSKFIAVKNGSADDAIFLDVKAHIGGKIGFVVEVFEDLYDTYPPKVTFQWYKNDSAIDGATNEYCRISNTESGNYHCVITYTADDGTVTTYRTNDLYIDNYEFDSN